MGNIGWLKRALPFLATFAVGVFVASFFVNISGHSSGYKSYKNKCRTELRELRIENEYLREENQQLLERHDTLRQYPVDPSLGFEGEDFELPNVEAPMPPPPPPAVKKYKVNEK